MPINQHTLWQAICQEVAQAAQSEPMLASFLHLTVLRHDSFARVLAFHLSSKLSSSTMDARALYETFMRVLESNPGIVEAAVADVAACYDRDPACDQYYLPLLYFKGFHAIQSHRINHWLWEHNRRTLAYFLQNRASEVFGVDIHPAAVFGHGIMFDHGTGIVIGETAVLGNIRIGHCAKIGAGSVVIRDVAPQTPVVGVPAKSVGISHNIPADDMDQSFATDDYVFMI